MKRVVASVLLFAGTLIFLWVTFGIGENLELRGAPAWAHFLRANITWPPAVRFLWRLYVGVSLTMMPNVLSLTALTMFGAVLGRLGWSPFGVVLFTYLLVLLNLPQMIYDSIISVDQIGLSILGLLTLVTWSWSYPAWSLLGFYLSKELPSGSGSRGLLPSKS